MSYCPRHDFMYPKGAYCPRCFSEAPSPTVLGARKERDAQFAATVANCTPRPATKTTKPSLPLDSAERKRWPMFSGLLRYFPAALAHVSNHSFIGNEKHNPGLPLQHARGKSGDHEDCIVRHLVDASEHPAGSAARIEELRALAWRTLALLQEECELAGHRPAPAATFNTKDKDANS